MSSARLSHPRYVGRPWRRWLLAVAIMLPVQAVQADEAQKLNARWNKEFTQLSYWFRGQSVTLPDAVTGGGFPAVGQRPQIDVKAEWPVVSLQARWTVDAKSWPAEHRARALDFILMRTCDVKAYQDAYPDVVQSSTMKFPPEFVRAVDNPADSLVRLMRGKSIGYEIVAEGGFGASDPVITTRIVMGLSADDKTVFYHDQPQQISDNLINRESLVAARDAGDAFHIQVQALYVCAPRSTFRDVALGRVSKSITYLVDRMYANVGKAPSGADIQRYDEIVRKVTQPLKDLVADEGGKGADARSLVNTRWRVIERRKPDGTPDGKYKEMLIEFLPQGRMVTTTTLADGAAQRTEQAFKWDVSGGAITVSGTEKTAEGEKPYKVVAVYEFEGDRLRVVSDRFVILAEPVRR